GPHARLVGGAAQRHRHAHEAAGLRHRDVELPESALSGAMSTLPPATIFGERMQSWFSRTRSPRNSSVPLSSSKWVASSNRRSPASSPARERRSEEHTSELQSPDH